MTRTLFLVRLLPLLLALMPQAKEPAFEWREVLITEAMSPAWMAEHRTNKFPFAEGWFAHTMARLLPPEKYFNDHPDWYALYEGKRNPAQPCFSSPGALDVARKEVDGYLKTHPETRMLSVSQNDSTVRCQCHLCSTAVFSASTPMIRFVNAIARDHPEIVIDTLAYMWSEVPPPTEAPLPNVQVRLAMIGACQRHSLSGCEVNRNSMANLVGWSAICGRLVIWHYGANFANFLQPLPDLHAIAENFRLYRRLGVKGVFFQGASPPGGGSWMARARAAFVASLLWDPLQPYNQAIDHALKEVYGERASAVRDWLERLEAAAPMEHAYVYDGADPAFLGGLPKPPRVQGREGKLLNLWYESAALQHADWNYRILRGKYKPVRPRDRESRAQKVLASIRELGIEQTRENEPLDTFRARLTRKPGEPDARVLENKQFRVVILPEPGGRVVEFTDKKQNKNLIKSPGAAEEGSVLHGGIDTAYSKEEIVGRFEVYKVLSSSRTALTLDGPEGTRRLELSESGLTITEDLREPKISVTRIAVPFPTEPYRIQSHPGGAVSVLPLSIGSMGFAQNYEWLGAGDLKLESPGRLVFHVFAKLRQVFIAIHRSESKHFTYTIAPDPKALTSGSRSSKSRSESR